MITVQYKDFDDMVAFAKNLVRQLGGCKTVEIDIPVNAAEPEKEQEAVTFIQNKQEPVRQAGERAEMSAPDKSEKTYALEDVRAKLAELNKSGKRAEVKSLLGSFGAVKLSDVPTDKYGELMEKAGEI